MVCKRGGAAGSAPQDACRSEAHEAISMINPVVRKYLWKGGLIAAAGAIVVMLICAFRYDKPDWLDAESKALALLAAGGFFVYKVISGYQKIDLKLSLRCERTSMSETTDLIIVFASLTKGDRGSLHMHDMQARFTWSPEHTVIVPFVGFDRLSFNTGQSGVDKGRKRLDWGRNNSSSPFIALPPGDSVQFACSSEIPKETIGTIEVAVLGVMRGSAAVAQWRSSYISAPLCDK
jgi:hypothetical protein